VPRFQPEELLRILEPQGVANLESLATALEEVDAMLRTVDSPDGLPFVCDAAFLRQMKLLNLTTRFGDLNPSFEPVGTGGYAERSARAVEYDLADALHVSVATLEDSMRSKEAANRDKDRQALPTLRLLLRKLRSDPPGNS
jgi:hypothetical protein